mmetsp:Transcript_17796/g.38457  ORF Transcript_17796/g.38457 Transcript_17796/m.38457 type:complete len:170 (-) Transcript_17796:321-830(-)
MGKKSRKPTSAKTNDNAALPPTAAVATSIPSTPAASPAAPIAYPSDGPSEEELACVQTTSRSLQVKLGQLVELISANDRAGFVSQFVPVDLSAQDAAGYLQDLTTAPEAEGQWTNLAAEIVTISAGSGVQNIEGDQETNAVFFFEHPLLKGCDREVSFVCTNGEWRAEG